MYARRLTTPEEKLQYSINCSTCFHFKLDIDQRLEELKNPTRNNFDFWGAFDENRNIISTLCNNLYDMYFDGQIIPVSGVGGVATPPEHRYSGAVRCIFDELLSASREAGHVFSFLQPFDHKFYRRFGYELCYVGQKYKLNADMLSCFSHKGWVKPYHKEDPIQPYMDLYNAFTRNYNLPMLHEEALLREKLYDDSLQSKRFSYLLGEGDKPLAYLTYVDEPGSDKNWLRVRDYAFDGREGLHALLGFLGRFTSDYGSIVLHLPDNICLPTLMERTPYQPQFECENWFGYMGRVLNASKALRLMKKPADCRFVIAVEDDQLPENSGNYLVTTSDVVKTDLPPDISVSIQALSQMVLGLSDLASAEMRTDVSIFSNRDLLDRVFIRKPKFITEFF